MMAHNMTPSSTPADPVSHPTVKLGDAEYPVKFRLYDLVELRKTHDIDLFVKTEVSGLDAVVRIAKVLSAGIAHVTDMSFEDVMKNIELTELPIFALAIAEAQKKVSPESQQALKALEAMNPEKPKASSKPN